MERGIGVLLDEFFADDDRILEVVAVPGHEGDERVPSQGQLAFARGRAVRNHLTFLHLLAQAYDRLLVETGPLVQTHKLAKRIFTLVNLDALAVYKADRSRFVGPDHHAAVQSYIFFQSR